MSALEKFFEMEKRNTTMKVEVIAGVTTFLSMAYIIFVNPDILSSAGMPREALVVATCLASAFGTLLAALWVKSPVAMAPGMGLNAFFAYSLVIGRHVSWQTALGIVFVSGFLYLILTLTGARDVLLKSIPSSVVKATSVGIGLFITFIGLKNLGLVVASEATLVKLGPLHGPVLAGLFGLVLTIFLERVRVRGSILIGIAGSTLLGFCMGYVKAPTALVNLSFDVSAIFMKLDILSALKWGFAGAIFSLIFADMFDSVGTIVACQKEAGLVEDDGSVRDFGRLLTADALAAAVGALFGTSTTTAYIESGTGIEAGGRTGMTSLVTAALFLLSILFVPVIAMVPGFATAPALVIVGLFMIRHVREIDFGNLEEGFPAFMTIIMMPLTYSISTGLAFGFISHTLLKVLLGRFRDVGIILAIVTAFSILSLVLQ